MTFKKHDFLSDIVIAMYFCPMMKQVVAEDRRSCGPILPQSLIDLLVAGVGSDDNDDERGREEDEVEFDDERKLR